MQKIRSLAALLMTRRTHSHTAIHLHPASISLLTHAHTHTQHAGTIMQNDWDELYAVLDLLSPGCLGDYGGFVEFYSKPIKRGQSSTASNYEITKVRLFRHTHWHSVCMRTIWCNGTLGKSNNVVAKPRREICWCGLPPGMHVVFSAPL